MLPFTLAYFSMPITKANSPQLLGHEITHVTQRHLARSLEAQQKSNPATIAGLLGAILLTIAVPQAGMAALATTQAMATQSKSTIPVCMRKKPTASVCKFWWMQALTPTPPRIFGKLATRYRFTTTPPQMLLTHPLPESRITEARNRAEQYPKRYIPDNLNFQLAKARIQVRFSSYSDEAVLSMFDRQLNKQTYSFKEQRSIAKRWRYLDWRSLMSRKNRRWTVENWW